jgi:UDP-N-acetyl-D-glucosamine dehydrogenase
MAYKRGVGDTRESPAIEIFKMLRDKGAEVSYADPHVPSIVIDGIPTKAVELTDETLAASDCVLIITDHPEFDYRRVVDVASLVVDTRNATWGISAPKDRLVRL